MAMAQTETPTIGSQGLLWAYKLQGQQAHLSHKVNTQETRITDVESRAQAALSTEIKKLDKHIQDLLAGQKILSKSIKNLRHDFEVEQNVTRDTTQKMNARLLAIEASILQADEDKKKKFSKEEELLQRLSSMDHTIAELQKACGALQHRLNAQSHEQVGSMVEMLQASVTSLENRTKSLETSNRHIKSVEARTKALETSNGELQKQNQTLTGRLNKSMLRQDEGVTHPTDANAHAKETKPDSPPVQRSRKRKQMDLTAASQKLSRFPRGTARETDDSPNDVLMPIAPKKAPPTDHMADPTTVPFSILPVPDLQPRPSTEALSRTSRLDDYQANARPFGPSTYNLSRTSESPRQGSSTSGAPFNRQPLVEKRSSTVDSNARARFDPREYEQDENVPIVLLGPIKTSNRRPDQSLQPDHSRSIYEDRDVERHQPVRKKRAIGSPEDEQRIILGI